MKTISNQTCNEIQAILQTFSQLRGSDALAQATSASTRFVDAQRRAGRLVKKLAAAVDKVDARIFTRSQKAAILQMLKEGERITPDDALQLCGCRRLSARIWELVHIDGHDIRRELGRTPEGNQCARYYMTIEPQQAMNREQTPKMCPTCGEELMQCENCEEWGCPMCNEEWHTTGDDILLCPECSAALQAEYDKETDNGTKVCGTCSLFTDEDAEGDGWCDFHQEARHCSNYCENRLPK